MSIRVLLADDDLDFLDVTAYALRRAGFVVDTVTNGSDALQSWNNDHDIVLLDVNMPTMAGIDVCRQIRGSSLVPVVLISGNRRESEIVRGFEAGADDYVAKPFSPQQLVMRLQAIYKRATGHTAEVTPHRIALPPLVIDLDSFSATVSGQPVHLTRIEFRLLYALAANVGRVVTTSRLMDFAWGMDGEGDAALLKTHFSHIRSKLNQAAEHSMEIRALAGTGYGLHIGES
jgi:DNA-binding response OmpR family regulator